MRIKLRRWVWEMERLRECERDGQGAKRYVKSKITFDFRFLIHFFCGFVVVVTSSLVWCAHVLSTIFDSDRVLNSRFFLRALSTLDMMTAAAAGVWCRCCCCLEYNYNCITSIRLPVLSVSFYFGAQPKNCEHNFWASSHSARTRHMLVFGPSVNAAQTDAYGNEQEEKPRRKMRRSTSTILEWAMRRNNHNNNNT